MLTNASTSAVPANRLLFATALVLFPLAAVEAIHPKFLPATIIGTVIFLAIAIADYLISRHALASVSLVFPEIVRLQKGRAGEMPIQILQTSPGVSRINLIVDWPEIFSTEGVSRLVDLVASTNNHRVAWPVTGNVRGKYFVLKAVAECPSRLGLWSFRRPYAIRTELRVYPDLMTERRAAAALFLNRGSLGSHIHRQAGKGSEFEKLREYQTGDGFDDIHWKASARRGKLTTKVYQAERTQEIYVIIDASRLSAREDAMEKFISSALLLALAAEQQGDLFGLLTFDSSIRTFLRAKSGPAHFDSCRDALYTLQPGQVSPDYEEVCTFIRTKVRKRSLLVFLTSLDDPVIASDFTNGIALLSQHLVIVNMLRPPGVAPLFSGTPLPTQALAYDQLAGHLRWSDLRQLELRLKRDGVHFHLLDQALFTIQLIRQYIEVKGRGLL